MRVTPPCPGEDSLGSVSPSWEAGQARAPRLPGTFWNFVPPWQGEAVFWASHASPLSLMSCPKAPKDRELAEMPPLPPWA